ncbi:hypothetical protein GJAV_G00268670 [Gymnothorax javanicus]|nr:hypothetical protein GJAV_G00268670 [Gymnothorax javanicus]
MELRTFKLILSTFSNNTNFTEGNGTDTLQSEGPYQAVEVVIIVLVTGSLSLVTITGNILVLLSIIINRNLQTINNYFLFSLACADLIIGVCSMNLFTVYLVIGYWPLRAVVCDLWLTLDYVVCSASVMNLLIISFDRYFCVTKPLSYPARRTTRMAGMMIAAAWILSFLLWAPPILFWQFIVGERTVPEGECYIQFLSDVSITLSTSIVSFYLPVAIMGLLYWQISRASKSRVNKGKQELKQGNLFSSKAGNHITMPCHEDSVKAHHTERGLNDGTGGVREEEPSAPVHPERNEIAEAPAGYEGNPTAHRLNATMAKQQPKKAAGPSREKKVTRTVMAILVAFAVMGTPYSVMVLITTFCSTCVPSSMWTFGYWLCYINSTINPACYALCNVTFKKTFKQLLLCQHKDIRLGR